MANWVSSAISFIAQCAASGIVEKIVEMGLSYLGKHMLPDDSEEALRRVKAALPQIRAVMVVAEALKMKDPSSSEWVQQFREAVDAAEDVLDELEYKKLKDMVKNRNKVGQSSSSSKKKTKRCAISGDIVERLKEAVTMLDQAVAGVERLLQHADRLGIHYLSESRVEVGTDLIRETTSILTQREVIGRDVEKGKILDWLKQPTQAQLSSFGIFGVGGLGKTTLAQFAYQEIHGLSYFQNIIWVCVSTDFSVKAITAKMLAELGGSSRGDNPLNVLQQSLKEMILSKKILLILDDIWEDKKREDLEQLISPLRFAQHGSKIIFTTRMKSVSDLLASVIDTEHKSLALGKMGEQELQLIFNSYAFNGFNPNNYGNLQAIGDQIVEKLQGSPLLAKVIGSLLNSHMDQPYWRRILNHDSLINLDQANNHVMEVLKLSYYNLPANLQVCFRFCSIYPQDYMFDKNELIEMWIASGFIPTQSCHDKNQNDIGEEYFNYLLRKSFFEKEYSWYYEEDRYVMHDLMHELAQNVSYGECCRVEQNDKPIVIPSTVRHVWVYESEIARLSNLENMRSLVITTSNSNLFVLPNYLIKRSLRLLKIHGDCSCKLPKEINSLVHLRYISIELWNEYLVPASIYNLYHLQVLELIGDRDESSYAEIKNYSMANLVCLRYMRVPDQIMQTIFGIHMLTSLQELTFFVGQNGGYSLNEIGPLDNLRCLAICNIENIRNAVEVRTAKLIEKKNLQSLSLKWASESNLNNPEQIIDNLQPNPNLMELEIEKYTGQRSPLWMMGDKPPLNLSSLKLYKCPNLNKQPIFGKIPNLKILHIHCCPKLEKLPDLPLSLTELEVNDVGLTSLPNLYQIFGINNSTPSSLKSSLKSLEIKECPNLISLSGFVQQDNLDLQGLEDLTIENCKNLAQLSMHAFNKFMSLEYLSISFCPNLIRLPCLPLSLIKFAISNMSISVLPEHLESSSSSGSTSTSSLKSSLREVSIQSCPSLSALNGFFQQDNIDFQAINTIDIIKCENLVPIPMGAFSKFVSLTYLTIVNCPKLVIVEYHNNLLPSRLESLFISNCGELDVPLLDSASGLTSLTELTIGDSANITHIPSSQNLFRSLCSLTIKGCSKLIDLSLIQQAHNVDHGNNSASLRVNDLNIDQLSLLLIEPLRSLRSVSELYVHDCSRMEALPEQWFLQNSSTLRSLRIANLSTLQSLPATMVRLIALEVLDILKADLLLELPELPVSLKFKNICGSGKRQL